MFTGIIETLGVVQAIEKKGTNLDFIIESEISASLSIDQSIAHNGVCLTIVEIDSNRHRVTAIEETLKISNLNQLKPGEVINLESAVPMNRVLDGHIVQGHVDAKGVCTSVKNVDGSWYFEFSYATEFQYLIVQKGSICINGVSLTVVNPVNDTFSVAIIPYTFEHTNFKAIQVGDQVNLEFDIIGKYVARHMSIYNSNSSLSKGK